MNYRLIKTTNSGDHIDIANEDGSHLCFPVDQTNPVYQDFLTNTDNVLIETIEPVTETPIESIDQRVIRLEQTTQEILTYIEVAP